MSERRYTMRVNDYKRDPGGDGPSIAYASVLDMHYCYREVWRSEEVVGAGRALTTVRDRVTRAGVAELARLEAEHEEWERGCVA